jgi:archaemetzincin
MSLFSPFFVTFLNMQKFCYPFFLMLLIIACHPASKPRNANKTEALASITKLKSLDKAIPPPKGGDWLAEHLETGQTFEEYMHRVPVAPNDSQNYIYLQPIGSFTDWQNKIVQYTAQYVESFFQLKTIVLNPISDTIIPKSSRRMRTEGFEQLHTLFILDSILLKNMPKNAIVSMGITAKDLYPEDSWNFVFGQAYTERRVGVSSIFRYSDVPIDSTNYNICLERIIKTSAHEIGHMFSCLHCINALCVMNGSNNMEEADAAPNLLCSDCLKKLSWNLHFKNRKRFVALRDFYEKHHLERDFEMAKQACSILGYN